LFDNLFPQQIADIVAKHASETTPKIAEEIAQTAYKVSHDRRATTPFAENAVAHGHSRSSARGGKQDDITVVVVRHATKNRKRE
jgi:hypothetical protein